jgi:hypothetical protein
VRALHVRRTPKNAGSISGCSITCWGEGESSAILRASIAWLDRQPKMTRRG